MTKFSLDSPILLDQIADLTHLELNAIRYTAGYVPRALIKKIKKSALSNKKDLLLSLHELIETDGENPASTAEWLNAINRGGLFCINDVTFDFFVALEYEVRSHIHAGQELGVVRSELQQSEDVLFHWSLIAAMWDDEVAAKLMTMIVELWVTVRGFSLASAWIEQYKGATKKTLNHFSFHCGISHSHFSSEYSTIHLINFESKRNMLQRRIFLILQLDSLYHSINNACSII